MKNHYLTFACLLVSMGYGYAQDTFSIVAVDATTGEVGSAGASCLDNSQITGGVVIISDPHPGRGAIHTQAWWQPGNQNNASMRMDLGDSPQEIIYWVNLNDVQNDSTKRQYGIVDFDGSGNPRVAAYTGSNTDDYKSHIIGPYYAIQGNILLGQMILDSIESRFLSEPGDLGAKLMAALQGANVAGADTRCLAEGVSSLSAFVRVARPCDTFGTFYMDLQVVETPFGVEPIDSLQVLFDAFVPSPPQIAGFTYTDSASYVYFTDASSAGAGSLLWDFGDGGGTSDTDPIHIYSSSGTYNVCLTANFPCMSLSYCDSVTVVIPTGISEQLVVETLLIYPNPGTGLFTLESDQSIKGGTLTVVNIDGKEVFRKSDLSNNQVNLDLTHLPKGIYVVRVSTDKTTMVTSLVFE